MGWSVQAGSILVTEACSRVSLTMNTRLLPVVVELSPEALLPPPGPVNSVRELGIRNTRPNASICEYHLHMSTQNTESRVAYIPSSLKYPAPELSKCYITENKHVLLGSFLRKPHIAVPWKVYCRARQYSAKRKWVFPAAVAESSPCWGPQ